MEPNQPTARELVSTDKPKRTDKQIWGIYIALCLISVVELYSASSHEVTAANVFAPVLRHVMFLIFGLVCMLILQNTHYKNFYKWSYGFAFFSVALMILTLICGDYINGARRSITIGITLQPAEMVKLSVALIVAAILCKEQMKGVDDVTRRGIVRVAAAVLFCGALLFSQGLTNTLLLMAIGLSMMLIGGVSGKKFFAIIMVFAVFGAIGVGYKYMMASKGSSDGSAENVEVMIPGTSVKVGTDASDPTALGSGGGRLSTWNNRLERYIKTDKYNDPITNENQQEQYSFIAQAHGGVLGVMPGNSRETARLPLAFSDYIYAIIIEELGLVGGIVVLVLYLWLLARAGRIASKCQTAFPALLVIGMAVFITFQAICHMAIVTGVFPVSGQPLPLISKGGTSIVITSIALGIMLSVSRFAARKGNKPEIKEELSELPDEVKAVNPS